MTDRTVDHEDQPVDHEDQPVDHEDPAEAADRRRRPSRRDGLLALAVCLAVVAVLAVTSPDPDTVQVDYVDAPLGHWAATRTYDAKLSKIEYATSVKPAGDYQDPVTSTETFVVATLTVRSKAKTDLLLDSIELHTSDGRIYHDRDQFQIAQLPIIQPGFTGHGQSVFEVPEDRLRGAQLVINPSADQFKWYDSGARFTLDDRFTIDDHPIRLGTGHSAVSR
ncbi:DUF4352 domain-containing protein [Microlunatus elymi]|uniref:DUF4352 domain-containing protein n=1 Tax=Microlunatus elymi TaxID=2596828 RepID=A0A516Q1D3_9ACTN|nr:DUF4352 domain-containing protein [Microlunatus elymi]QDP97240.1 DUF4352 domain-containing protein [Microlunatus elymi]